MSIRSKRVAPTSSARIASFICAAISAAAVSCSAFASDQPDHAAAQAHASASFANLPLSFEANYGQVDNTVKFLSHGSGFRLYFTGNETVIALTKPITDPARKTGSLRNRTARLDAFGVTPGAASAALSVANAGLTRVAAEKQQFTMDVLRMRLAGARLSQPEGLERLPGTVNYILGNQPSQWHTGIPTYSRVRYSGVYRGIDLVYYGNRQQLEYDFIVAPGADPSAIRMDFAGVRGISIDAAGALRIAMRDGSLAFHSPVLYQVIGGKKKTVAGRFLLRAGNTVGFEAGPYDRRAPLVIDPILAYSTFFGGSNGEYIVTAASDKAGDLYVGGLTISTDFPVTPGAFQALNYAESTNAVSTAFVSKFNPSGTALLYSTFLGGNAIPDTLHLQGDYVHGLAVDSAGNAYVTGWTYSSNFPVTKGAFQSINQAASFELANGFVTKLNPAGTALVYSTYLGGDLITEPNAIAIDSSGNAYISGLTFCTNFPTTPGAYQTINRSAGVSGFNAFVTKVNPTGTGLVFSTYLGGNNDYGTSIGGLYWTNPIALDKSGNVYVAGYTGSGDFPVTPGAFQSTNHGTFNITVTKLNPAGTALIYSTLLGGNTVSISQGLAVDSAGNAYVAGYTSDRDFPVTAGAFQSTNKADQNTALSTDTVNSGFLTKLNPAGTALVYSTYLGGSTGPWGGDHIYGLAIDSSGDAYVAGGAMSDDFPVTANAWQPKNHGATHCCDYTTYTSDAFLTVFNPTGKGLIYSTYLGGSGTQNPEGAGGYGDEAYYLALGPNQNVYVVGYTSSPNFPVTGDAFETKYTSNQNTGFVADFDLGAAPDVTDSETTLTATATSVVPGAAVTFTAAVAPATGSAVATGSVTFSVDEAAVATVALNGAGKSTWSTSSLAAGGHYILATYGGSATLASSGDGLNEFVIPVKPVITPPAGTYTSQQTVAVTDTTGKSVLYYTLDGSAPTVFSSQYTAPITVNTSKTFNVVAVSGRIADSAEVSAAYTIVGSPSVLAAPATSISTPKATLNAYVNTQGLSGSYYFVYGTSSASLTSTTSSTALPASSTRAAASTQLSALASKTTYYYQVVVTTAGGTTAGAIQSFATN